MKLRERLVRLAYSAVSLPVVAGPVERISGISDRVGLAKLLSDLDIDCVLDVGANEGQYARLLRRIGFKGLIISFEPDTGVFQQLRRAFDRDPNWRGFNCALGSADAQLKFHVHKMSQTSSFLPTASPASDQVVNTVEVPVKRLDSFLPEVLPDWRQRRLMLKCDTQGYDLEVVRGAEAILSVVHVLQSEVAVQSIYRGMPRYLEAIGFYESLGFVLIDLWLNNRTVDGDALEYDCIMRRAIPHQG